MPPRLWLLPAMAAITTLVADGKLQPASPNNFICHLPAVLSAGYLPKLLQLVLYGTPQSPAELPAVVGRLMVSLPHIAVTWCDINEDDINRLRGLIPMTWTQQHNRRCATC